MKPKRSQIEFDVHRPVGEGPDDRPADFDPAAVDADDALLRLVEQSTRPPALSLDWDRLSAALDREPLPGRPPQGRRRAASLILRWAGLTAAAAAVMLAVWLGVTMQSTPPETAVTPPPAPPVVVATAPMELARAGLAPLVEQVRIGVDSETASRLVSDASADAGPPAVVVVIPRRPDVEMAGDAMAATELILVNETAPLRGTPRPYQVDYDSEMGFIGL